MFFSELPAPVFKARPTVATLLEIIARHPSYNVHWTPISVLAPGARPLGTLEQFTETAKRTQTFFPCFDASAPYRGTESGLAGRGDWLDAFTVSERCAIERTYAEDMRLFYGAMALDE